MDIGYSEKVKQWPEGYSLVQNATKQLEEAVGKWANVVSGEWDRGQDDKGQDVLTLRLKDPNWEVLGKYAPNELRSAGLRTFNMNRLWGEILQRRLEKQLGDMTGEGNRHAPENGWISVP